MNFSSFVLVFIVTLQTKREKMKDHCMLTKGPSVQIFRNINEVVLIVWKCRTDWFGTNSKRQTKRPV